MIDSNSTSVKNGLEPLEPKRRDPEARIYEKLRAKRRCTSESLQGSGGSAVKIGDPKRELKRTIRRSIRTSGYVEPHYLIDQRWVQKTIDVEKTVNVRGGTIPSKVTWYEIAAPGVDAFEGSSDFQRAARYEGININATGNNVGPLLGEGGNVWSMRGVRRNLHHSLTGLKTAIAGSTSLSEEQKLDLSGDVESIKGDRLAKTKPDQDAIVSHGWSGLERLRLWPDWSKRSNACAHNPIAHSISASDELLSAMESTAKFLLVDEE